MREERRLVRLERAAPSDLESFRMPVVSVVAMLFALASSVTKITALKGRYPELVCLGFGPGV